MLSAAVGEDGVTDGSLFVWGSGACGQLGTGDTCDNTAAFTSKSIRTFKIDKHSEQEPGLPFSSPSLDSPVIDTIYMCAYTDFTVLTCPADTGARARAHAHA